MSKHAVGIALASVCCLSMGSTTAEAQSLLGKLSNLLVEQRPSGPYVPDVAAAEATRDTVGSLIAVELGTLPVASSSGGFVYRLRSDLGVFERASNQFGPFFTERTLRNSRGQTSFGFSYQATTFGSLQGGDLQSGTFPTNAARATGAVDPFSVDSLKLTLRARIATPFFSYGVTDKLAVGVVAPIVNVWFDGLRMNTANSVSTVQSVQSGSATGIGDMAINGRYLVAGNGNRGVTIGGDWRLPTGRQEDLLGTGKAGGRFLAAASWEEDRLAIHLNGGYGVGGVSREAFWSTATAFAVDPRLTVIGEIMGRRLSSLNRVSDVYQPHPVQAGVETMRWLPGESGIQNIFVVVGAKWNVGQTWLLNTNVLMRLTDAGLHATFTPGLTVDYTFER